MTPLEQAKHLIDIFSQVRNYTSVASTLSRSAAKECALITVDGILKVAPIDKYEDLQSDLTPEDVGLYLFEEYWQEVRKELETL